MILGAFALLISCAKDDTGVRPSNSAIQINLTDAPGDYDQVNIDLVQVRIKMKQGGSWQDVTTNTGVYDLLQLTNGVDTTVVNDSVPTGDIQQIRFVLGTNNTIMVDSVLYPLATPSAWQSGLKLNLNKATNRDSITNVLIDFDAAVSIVEQGNGNYSLKPVLRVL